MPTTPPATANAPPELPGLSAASVWITSSMIRACGHRPTKRADHPRGDRARQAERVADGDHGLPDHEVVGLAELGRIGGSPAARTTAKSESGSASATRNGVFVPSENAAVPAGECRPRAHSSAEIRQL